MFLSSLVALMKGRVRLHGRINLVFFILTMITLFVFELVIRVVQPELMSTLENDARIANPLKIHLYFAIPSALLMPFMLITGLKHYRRAHLTLAVCFGILWAGTVITGIFFLPHSL